MYILAWNFAQTILRKRNELIVQSKNCEARVDNNFRQTLRLRENFESPIPPYAAYQEERTWERRWKESGREGESENKMLRKSHRADCRDPSEQPSPLSCRA